MKRISLTSWIMIGLAAGVVVGVFAPGVALHLQPYANIFLSLIRSIIAPLIFATMVYGIAGTGDMKSMGRIGLKAIINFEVVTTLALFLGLGVVAIMRPGIGVVLTRTAAEAAAVTTSGGGFKLENAFTASIFDSFARNDALQIVIFAFLFGAACSAMGEKAKPVIDFCGSLAQVMFKFTWYAMYMAPIGVGCAIAFTIASKGAAVLLGLGKLVIAMYVCSALCIVLILLPCLPLFHIPIRKFYHAVKEPFMIGFSTASGAAALPPSMEKMEEFGCPKHIVGFVLPVGLTFNLVGSAVYLSIAAIFVAQASGEHLSLGKQLAIMLTLMLTSKGVAGVPRAALVVLAATLSSLKMPMEGIAVLLGVDAILDMARTCLNVLGNCVATAVISRWEGYTLGEGPQEAMAVAAVGAQR